MADTSSTEKRSLWAVYKPLIRRYFRPHRCILFWAVLAGVVAGLTGGFGLPVILQRVVPIVFGTRPAPDLLTQALDACPLLRDMDRPMLLMWMAALFMPLLMLVRGLATYFNTYLLTVAGTRVLSDMRLHLFERLQWLSFSFLDRHSRGDTMTTTIQYTQMLQGGMVMVMNNLVVQPLTLLSAVGFLAYNAISNEASGIMMANLAIAALAIPLVRWVGRTMVKQMQTMLAGLNKITETVEETLSAQREVRAFNLQPFLRKRLVTYIRSFNGFMIKMCAWSSGISPAIEVVSALALAYALYQGCSRGMSLEDFTALATACYLCYDPIKNLSATFNQIQIMAPVIKSLNAVLYAKDETPEPSDPLTLPQPTAGVVDFEKVCFSYEPGKPVLTDINVHVPAGQVVGLVGPSGSGKTTFINLVCRFYEVDSGSVSIDGVDVRRLKREDRTRAIGLVSQFAALFRGTIADNISAGRPGATREEVMAAGEAARVSEFAMQDPDGYDRMLEEGGIGLSGGQRQRVSIARAFLKNAPVLILDEATSALDMKSEALIQGELEKLARGHTTFIIAHRFSTLRMAQRLLVFEKGRIIADGTHDELYEQCPLYRTLYDEQVSEAQQNSRAAC